MLSRTEVKKQTRQLKRIFKDFRVYLDSQHFYPRRRTYLDAALLTLASKTLTLAGGIVCLVRNDFPEEAFATSRSLIELALNVRYITNGRTPETRAKRFVDFVSKIKIEWGKRAMTHFNFSQKEMRQIPSYREFRTLQRKFPKQSWVQASRKHAKGVWTMAMERDRFERAPILDKQGRPALDKRGRAKTKPYTWELDYQVIYFWTSQYVHVTIDSLDNHAAVPDKAFKVYVPGVSIPQNSRDFGDMALFNTALYVQKIFIAIFRALGHPYPDKLSGRLHTFIKSSSEASTG